jgi:hypothetical protein
MLVLPWRTRRCWSITNAHGSKSSDVDLTITPIPIPDQIAGSLFPAASFRDLICDPFCDRMRGDTNPQYLSSAVPHNQQAIEQTKRDCRHDKQIHRRDAVRMITQERLPPLRWRASSPDHILGHARLPDIDAQLEQFTEDTRRSPWCVLNAHLEDQVANFQRHDGATAAASRLPAPIRPETRAMPADNGVRLNDRQSIANSRKQPIKPNEYQSVYGTEGEFLWSSPPQDVYLLPQRPNLSLKRCLRPEQIDDRPANKSAKIPHPTTGLPDSRLAASRMRFTTGTTGCRTKKRYPTTARLGSANALVSLTRWYKKAVRPTPYCQQLKYAGLMLR